MYCLFSSNVTSGHCYPANFSAIILCELLSHSVVRDNAATVRSWDDSDAVGEAAGDGDSVRDVEAELRLTRRQGGGSLVTLGPERCSVMRDRREVRKELTEQAQQLKSQQWQR